MLTQDKVIAIYCIIDDLMKGIGHAEDTRRRISDSEVVTTALVSALYFGGNQVHAIHFMKHFGLIPMMLDKSRFNRRLHAIGELLSRLFIEVGKYFKEVCCEMHYIVDSFPVAICDNIRILRSKIVKGKKWRGYTASMRRYFYGVKVQLVTTGGGIPIAFHFTPGKQADCRALDKIIADLPPEASLYADSAYTDYQREDLALEKYQVLVKSQRKNNSKRPDSTEQARLKTTMRKKVEATISDIKKLFPRTIHAVTLNGFLIKLILFIFGLQLNKSIN